MIFFRTFLLLITDFYALTLQFQFPRVGDHIDWCFYFQKLQIYKPECKFYDEVKQEFEMKPTPKAFPIAIYQRQQCSQHYMYCTANTECGPDHKRCIDMLKYRECCAPNRRQCPSVNVLNFRCLVSNPVSWCRTDLDCHTTPQKMCCPTGCNYNICL